MGMASFNRARREAEAALAAEEVVVESVVDGEEQGQPAEEQPAEEQPVEEQLQLPGIEEIEPQTAEKPKRGRKAQEQKDEQA